MRAESETFERFKEFQKRNTKSTWQEKWKLFDGIEKASIWATRFDRIEEASIWVMSIDDHLWLWNRFTITFIRNIEMYPKRGNERMLDMVR